MNLFTLREDVAKAIWAEKARSIIGNPSWEEAHGGDIAECLESAGSAIPAVLDGLIADTDDDHSDHPNHPYTLGIGDLVADYLQFVKAGVT